MKADRFLKNLEESNLLSAKSLDKLRAQLGDKATRMSANAFAKLLIGKGLITKQQARDAIVERVDLADPEADADDVIPLEEEPANAPRSDSDLGFAPLEEDETPIEPSPIDSGDRAEPKVDLPPQQDIVELDPVTPDEAPADSFDEFGFSVPGDVAPPPFVPPSTSPVEPPPAGAPLADDIGDEDALASGVSTERTKRKKRTRKKRSKKGSEFDSPLILLGGGGLILLALIAVIVWYLLNRDTGDALLASANDQFKGGSYSQAIDSYERFLKSFPSHARVSDARVQLSLAKIRKVTEGTTDFEKSLATADAEIRQIEDEEKFHEAHNELAALLERIVRGLAQQAVSAEGTDAIEQCVADTEEALRLINNTKYVPKSLRPVETIEDVRQMLELVERRRAREEMRQTAIAAIGSAAKSGDVRAAYQVYRELIGNHPEFTDDALLRDAVVEIAEAERARTLFVEEQIEADSGSDDSKVVASITLAHRVGESPSGQSAETIFFRIDGALYALDAGSGDLLWRRFIGFDSEAAPLRLEGDVVVVDKVNKALIRLEGKTGSVRWRLKMDDELLAPVQWNENQVLLATRSGKLWVVDAKSGAATGFVQFSQSLPAPPFVDAKNERVFVVAEHSNIYLLVGEKLLCKDVFYLGHLASSISVSPVAALGHIVVVENFGENASKLHGLSLLPDGTLQKSIDPIRLEGHVTTPPVVDGRRIAVVTDRGEIRAFDVAAGQSENPLVQVASRGATGDTAQQFAMLHPGNLWVAGNRLSKFAILPTGGRLQAASLPKSLEGDAFDGPLRRVGDSIIHVRRRSGQEGATVAALKMKTGQVQWQSHLAAPPAGEPLIDQERREIVAASRNGQVYFLDEKAIRARVHNTPLSGKGVPNPIQLHSSMPLANGLAVFAGNHEAAADGFLLLQRTGGQNELRWIAIQEGAMACTPVPFADGLLAPLQIGQVVLANPTTGRITATFQPRIDSLEPTKWTRPAVTPDGKQFTVADRKGRLFLIDAPKDKSLQMKAVAEIEPLPSPIGTPAAIIGNTVVVGTDDGRIRTFSVPELGRLSDTDVGKAISWGPYAIGESALCATDTGEVVCIGADGNLRWQEQLGEHPPAGRPLPLGDDVVLAMSEGVALRVRVSDGSVTTRVDVGQPLAAGPVQFGKRWILTTYDGALLVVDPT